MSKPSIHQKEAQAKSEEEINLKLEAYLKTKKERMIHPFNKDDLFQKWLKNVRIDISRKMY